MVQGIQEKHGSFNLKKEGGFSMVEAMVTTLIFSFIVAGIYGASAVGEASWQTNDVRIQLQQETRKAMERMIHELRGAGDSSITNVPEDGNTYTTITFRDPTGVTSGSLVWNVNTIQYSLGGTGGKQLLRTSGGTSTVIGDNFQTLQFIRQSTSPDILAVSMVTQKNTIKGRPISYQLNFNIQLRN